MKKTLNSGIYVIRNIVNGYVYIGSTKSFIRRRIAHFYNLRKGSHSNKHLQRAWDKYGKENFEFFPISYTTDLIYEEQYWINYFWGNGCYNGRKTAQGGSGNSWNKGKKMSKEYCEKLSKAHMGNKRPAGVTEKILKTVAKKYPIHPLQTKESREKARQKLIGRKRSPESIAKRTETRRLNRLKKQISNITYTVGL